MRLYIVHKMRRTWSYYKLAAGRREGAGSGGAAGVVAEQEKRWGASNTSGGEFSHPVIYVYWVVIHSDPRVPKCTFEPSESLSRRGLHSMGDRVLGSIQPYPPFPSKTRP